MSALDTCSKTMPRSNSPSYIVFRLLNLHNQLFWFMYPSPVSWNSEHHTFVLEGKYWKIIPWFLVTIGLCIYFSCSISKQLPSPLTLWWTFGIHVCLAIVLWIYKSDFTSAFNSIIRFTRVQQYTCKC